MTPLFETLSLDITDGVAILTLDRPATRNAINSQMNRELPLAWQFLEHHPAVRVIIVTGASDKAFCTGADLADLPVPDDEAMKARIESIAWTNRQNKVSKPVIAAINGLVVGGGLHFLADADINLCADHVQFLDTHVAVGLVAALEPISLARRMPLGSVMKLAFSGGSERLSAAEAHRLGLIDELLPLSDLMARAKQLAVIIARHSPTAVARSKAAIWSAIEKPLDQSLQYGWDLIMRQEQHPDFQEGISAFLENRAPNWQNRQQGDL